MVLEAIVAWSQRNVRHYRSTARLVVGGFACTVLLGLAFWPAVAAGQNKETGALTFGILPIGGPSESLVAWRPMLDGMSAALHRPVRSISVSTYEGLAAAIAEERVDVAFVSGRMALQAVTQDRMDVIAQLTRGDGSHGYYAVLLVLKDSPIQTLADLYAQPGHWRFARGEALSTSGYLVPETQLFASHKLDSNTFFATVKVDNHQNNALAVVNGEVDVATNNTADMERFAQQFPDQDSRLRILWKSTLIPHAVIIVRKGLAPELRADITTFITHYAKDGHNAAAELAKLKRIHDISGFAHAGNAVLTPFADIDYQLDRRRAFNVSWVSDAARQARLQKIESAHSQILQMLESTENTP